MYPRKLSRPGGSSTSNQRKGISLIISLTFLSSSILLARISEGAEAPFPHVATLQWEARAISASPTIRRKIEPLWLPPPVAATPRCWDNLFQSLVREFAVSACVPMRTTRGLLSEAERDSPGSKKKYTPRFGHFILPLQFESLRIPPTPVSNRSRAR